MKRKIAAVLTAAALCILLTGCGENQIPDLTKEELQLIGEYTAITLMKYNAGKRSRLVELQPETSVSQQPADVLQPEESGEQAGMRPTDDTPIVNAQGETAGNAGSPEEALKLPEGVLLEYREHELCEAYPYREGEDNFLTVNATGGKKLLVLHFSLVNGSGQDQELDLRTGGSQTEGMEYRITVNGSYTRRALTTMLLNDMTSFCDTVPAGESAEVVLVIEVEEETAAELSSVSLKVKNGAKTYTIQLN